MFMRRRKKPQSIEENIKSIEKLVESSVGDPKRERHCREVLESAIEELKRTEKECRLYVQKCKDCLKQLENCNP